jgi:hypothetical protein
MKDYGLRLQGVAANISMQARLNLGADDRQTAFHMPGDVKVNFRIDVSRHDRSAGSPLKRAGLVSVHVTRPYNGRSNNLRASRVNAAQY